LRDILSPKQQLLGEQLLDAGDRFPRRLTLATNGKRKPAP
jgi:hypothetical protein